MARPDSTTLQLREARAYIFRVLYKGKPKKLSGVASMTSDGLFVLPRNPIQVNYQAGPRKFSYAVGTMEKRADVQGVDPPIITIGVDFGERGSYDAKSGKGLDGRRAMRALESLIRGYLKAVAEAGRDRMPLHVLEFHDIYRGESWVVMPENVPYGAEDAGRPVSESATLRLEALRRVEEGHKIDPAKSLPPKLREKAHHCPLHPACKYGGPSEAGCPYRNGGKK